MNTDIRIIEFNSPSDSKIPKWKRTLAVSHDGTTIYMPAAVAGNETKIGMCASYDGVSAAVIHKHLFLPTSWLTREYPDIADICANAEAKARESL
jgi:hypothetical protein